MPVNVLNEDIVHQIKELFEAQLEHPVEMIYFSKHDQCESCGDTQRILEELTALSDKLHVNTYDLNENHQIAQHYQVELAPGLVIAGRTEDKLLDYGIRFAGIPSGYEFSSLIQDIILVSKRDSGLKSELRDELKCISKPVHLQVFVTPT